MKTDLFVFLVENKKLSLAKKMLDEFELQNVIAYKQIYIFHSALQKLLHYYCLSIKIVKNLFKQYNIIFRQRAKLQ
jgi:hypothetical protein